MLFGDLNFEAQVMPLLQAVSAKTGIIQNLIRPYLYADSPSMQFYMSKGSSCSAPINSYVGVGAKADPQEALLASLCEALERYSSFTGSDNTTNVFHQTTAMNLKKHNHLIVDLELLKTYTPNQLQTNPYLYELDENSPVDWIATQHLATKDFYYVPTEFIFCHKRPPRFYSGATTSGLAAGRTTEQALLAGSLELIERDSVMAAWWSKRQSPQVKIFETRNTRLLQILQSVRPLESQIRLLALQNEFDIPVFLAAFYGRSQYQPKMALAASCNLDPIKAIEKALLELCHIIFWSTKILDRGAPAQKAWKSFDDDILSFSDSVDYYLSHGGEHIIDLFTDHSKLVSVDSFQNRSTDHSTCDLSLIAQTLKSQNVDLYGVDITPLDVENCNIRVARAFSPQLIPINSSHKLRPWGKKRLTVRNELPQPFP